MIANDKLFSFKMKNVILKTILKTIKWTFIWNCPISLFSHAVFSVSWYLHLKQQTCNSITLNFSLSNKYSSKIAENACISV